MKKTKWALVPAGLLLAGVAVAGHGFDRYTHYKGVCGGDMSSPTMRQGARADKAGFSLPRMADELELTDEQRETIRGKVRASRDKEEDIRDKMYASRKALRELMWAEKQDEAQLHKLADKLGEAKTELIVLRAKTRQAIVAELTEQQRAKLKQLADTRGGLGGRF